MGYKLYQPGCPCCQTKKNITTCISLCGTGQPDYEVDFYQNNNLKAYCITDSGGCCTVSIPTGYYVLEIFSPQDSLISSGNRTVTSNITVGLSIPSSVCCSHLSIPYHLTLTDNETTIDFDYYPFNLYPTWYGGHSTNRLSCSVTTPFDICVAADPDMGPVRVCYQMACIDGALYIQRSWSWVYEQGTLTPIYFQDDSGFTAGQPCTTGPPAMCGSPHTDVATGQGNISSDSPFVLSADLIDEGTNYTLDPISGGVVISS